MRHICAALIALFALASSCEPATAQSWPDAAWTRADPAALGWSAEKLAAAERVAADLRATAVMVVQRGQVVASFGDVTDRVKVASVRKSLLSALYGIANAAGRVDLKRTLKALDIDDRAGLTETERTATVRDLLMARSGIYHAAGYETPDMAAKRPPRGSHPPGTFWYYNNWDFNALGTIYERLTQTPVFEAFARDIATPIGMEDYRAGDGTYVHEAMSDHPAYVFAMSARDLARFGLLFARGGRWKDRQVVPEAWVRESTSALTAPADFGLDYGYMWWVVPAQGELTLVWGRGAYFALGYGGQAIAVAPSRDLVVVIVTHLREGRGMPQGGVGTLMRAILAARPQ